MDISENVILQEFLDFMHSCGIIPKGNLQIVMDGKIHRFRTEGDKSGETSGAYFIHSDGWPNGGVMDYRKHNGMQKWKLSQSAVQNSEYHKPTPQEIQQRNDEKKQKELLQAENDRLILLKAWREFDSAKPLTYGMNHSYLNSKHITIFDSCDIQLRVKHKLITDNDTCRVGELLIPMLNADNGQFQSMIRIPDKPDANGKFLKQNYKGTHILGSCAELIPSQLRTYAYIQPDFERIVTPADIHSDSVYLCEGIATAFSVLEILKCCYPVLCVGSCNNLIHVAKSWRKRYPKIRIIICADNDVHRKGINEAQKVINEGYADALTMPPVEGYDWNDYLIHLKGFKA